MLNLFSLKESNHAIKLLNTKSLKKTSKHFPSPLREWNDSIYAYNKNNLNLLPSTSTSINNIIKTYFNLYNKRIDIKVRTRKLLLRHRRLSSNKYYISNGGFKHTNNKILINLFVFNRQKINYLLTLKKWYLKTFLKKTLDTNWDINHIIIKRFKLINEKGIEAVKMVNENKYSLIKALNNILESKKYKVNSFKSLSNYTENFYKNLIKKSFWRMKKYFYYKQLLYINKSKLNYTYLQHLKNYLERFYNKNVEFNIINIKRFYLNSDILSESITVKLTRNRRKISRFLNKLKKKIDIREKGFLDKKLIIKPRVLQNLTQDQSALHSYIFDNLKYKHVTGFKLEAKGRLSKRFTASRSVYKIKYKGALLNIDSSYKGLSSVILKGTLKPNSQYTNLNSKSRIGSFGIKGWISGN